MQKLQQERKYSKHEISRFGLSLADDNNLNQFTASGGQEIEFHEIEIIILRN